MEPEILKNWDNIYSDIYKSKEGKEKFILHSGPPYANGDIHIGHALNGILKDIICKSENMKGRQAALVFGWDCHGLPIEWKIEEQVIKNKESIEKIGEKEFRKRCKDFALHWVSKQKSSFKRLGIFFDEKNPYITMEKSSQAAILKGLRNVILNDLLYCAKRPVFWSVIEKTALAEAEVEYKTIKSKAIYVGFKVKKSKNKNLSDAKIIIWTTTPWTIPGNRAICFNEKIEYILIDIDGDKFIIARDRLEEFKKDINNPNCKILIEKISTDDIKSIICNHPMDGYDFDVPMLGGDHVTTEMGTGFVHTAPCYGEDDFKICKKNGIAPDDVINDNGVYKDDINVVSGMHIFKAGKVIIEHLKEKNNLVFEYDFEHSYPHSWRSKAPLIYRATSQFFIDLSKTDIREKAIKEIKKTKWHPKKSINRITQW